MFAGLCVYGVFRHSVAGPEVVRKKEKNQISSRKVKKKVYYTQENGLVTHTLRQTGCGHR